MILCLLAYVPTNFLIVGNVITGIGITAVWLLGSIAYVLYHNVPVDVKNSKHVMLLIMGLVIFSFCAFVRYYLTLNAFDILGAFCLTGVFYCCAWISRMEFLNFMSESKMKAFCRFGAGYAFSIYLTHYSLNVFLKNLTSPYVTFILCNLFAIGFSYFFERHYKDMAEYLHARRAARR